MNAPSTLGFWLQLIAVMAVGATVVVGLAELLGRWARSAKRQRALWQTALLGLLVLALCELTGLANVARGVGRGAWGDVVASDREEARSELMESSSLALTGDEKPEARDDQAGNEHREAGSEATEPPFHAVTRDERPNATDELESSASVSSSPLAPHFSPLAWLWLAGMVFVMGRVLVANMLLQLFRWRHPEASSPVLADRVERIATRLGLHGRVRILEGKSLSGPVAFGVLRPTLALPSSFTDDFDAPQQEVMLAHELAHLAARDPCWHLLADLLTALWWWHPLVWWSRHQLRAASEAAADEASLIVADGPGVLASCLVALGTQLVERRQPGWLRMAGSGFRSSLGRRVERLLRLGDSASIIGNATKRRTQTWLTLSLGSMTLLAAALASTAWARSSALEEGDPTMPNMKQSWKQSLAGLMLLSTLAASDTPSAGQEPMTGESRRAKEEKLVSAPLATILAPLIPGESSAESSDVATVESQKLQLPIQIDPAQAQNIRELKLYDSTDRGKTWKLLSVATVDQRAFSVSVVEGLHWFGIVWVDKGGNQHPAETAQVEPSVKVVVKSGQNTSIAPETPEGDARDRDLQQIINDLKKELDALRANYEQLRAIAAPGTSQDRLVELKRKMDDLVAAKDKAEAELKALKAKTTRVFRLVNCDPQEVYSILAALLKRGEGEGPNGQGSFGAFGNHAGRRGQTDTTWRMAADPRTNSLIIRGTEQDVKTAADIVALVDAAAGKAQPKVKNLMLFKLRFARADETVGVLLGLGMDARLVPMNKSNAILASGSEESMKEIRDLIAILDVDVGPSKTGTKGTPGGGSN